jgi:ABC-type Mn2+/Zn2+ transport system ATPase subunit
MKITGLSYGFVYNDFIIEGIDLTISQGQFVSIIGPRGGGKTTLLKLICGIYEPWNGDIEYICNDCDSIFYHPSVGYVPQIGTIDWNLPVSVQEYIAMGSWNYKSYLPWINTKLKNQIKEILKMLGLSGYEKRQMTGLAKGEKQMVLMGRALIRNPDIFILDEPTTDLDYLSREKIFGLLKDLNNKGMTIIMSTYDITHVANRSPWIICLNKYVIAEGPPQTVLTEDNLIRTYGLSDPKFKI